MKRGFTRAKSLLLILLYILSIFIYSGTGIIKASATESAEAYAPCPSCEVDKLSADVKISSRFYELLFGKATNKKEDGELMLYPGGSVFGVLIDEVGATVCGACTAEKLRTGDRIISANGKPVADARDIEETVRASGGAAIELEVMRSGTLLKLSVTPTLKDGEYKLGATLRSQTAGIGTITFIDPNTHLFGGLGHGVTDSENGSLVTVEAGSALGVVLGGCKRGEAGRAGELVGVLNRNRCGNIFINTECGIFGILSELPSYATEPMQVAPRGEVHKGEAEIISTVSNGKRQTYKIEIEDIDYESESSKSFKIKVTDPTLIALTGGIVRGMSGSPIIQDGKLVGAVTHVMVADPTEGYGIFIENMLSAAQNQVIPKAA